MRFITADYVFPVTGSPVKDGIVIVKEDGSIEDVVDPQSSSSLPLSSSEKFNGIICPGFINAHCHLELSHLKNKLTPGKGLPSFIREIAAKRSSSMELIREAIADAEDEMIRGGIVAVGDISNFDHSFDQKRKRRLHYHTFIEIFDLEEKRAEAEFQKGLQLEEQLSANGNQTNQVSITPHAPYTVSAKLMKMIAEHALTNRSPISIHNQETATENEMFMHGTGELFNTLSSFGDYYQSWKPTGKHSLASIIECIPVSSRIQFVHNTYSTEEDIRKTQENIKNTWWCTCPNANLFIEDRLPDYKLFIDAGCRMAIGTDSYASNWSLSMLDEMKTISNHAPFIPLETLLQWATLNVANLLGFENELGSIEKGKRPGLNLLKNIDLKELKLTKESVAEKIL